MSEAFIGVDVGTGSARAGVFDGDGRLLASARRPIRIWREGGDVAEHSSDDIWDAACSAVREAVRLSHVSPESIAGLGFDATCSLVVLDEQSRPLPAGRSGDPQRDTIVWMDHRAAAEAEEISLGEHEFLRYVGGAVSPEMQRRNCFGCRATCRAPSPPPARFSISPIFLPSALRDR